jgi:hypothetical protein
MNSYFSLAKQKEKKQWYKFTKNIKQLIKKVESVLCERKRVDLKKGSWYDEIKLSGLTKKAS